MKPPINKVQNQMNNNNNNHLFEMKCLLNCINWKLSINKFDSEGVMIYNHSNSSLNTNKNCLYINGRNYFLSDFVLNYTQHLMDFKYFEMNTSFLDLFFVKSFQQNKDKIKVFNLDTSSDIFPISNSYLNKNSDSESFKFFVNFDLSNSEVVNSSNFLFTEKIEFNIESNVHNTTFFKQPIKIILEGDKILQMIKDRHEKILHADLSDLKLKGKPRNKKCSDFIVRILDKYDFSFALHIKNFDTTFSNK